MQLDRKKNMADFGTRLAAASALTVLAASLMAPAASAQNFPISPTQRATSPAAEGFAEHLVKVLAKQP